MKEIKLSGLDQSVFTEKLENGLEVYMIPYTNKTNYSMHYITKYGSINQTFIPVGQKEKITIPDGTAHFLEHKMFEQEDGMDPFTFATQSGTSSNASTSYQITRYYFEGTNCFKENLDYLLTYVHSPYFTEENVEKEKGIIKEEIRQYDDEIDWILDEELRKSLFQNDATRIDIAGTVESIQKITKEILYQTYNTYYQPSNMVLFLSGCFDPKEALSVIKKNKALAKAGTKEPIREEKEEEPVEVNRKEYRFSFPVVHPKVAYGIKVPLPKEMDKYKFYLYVGMILSLLFGLASPFRERMKKEKKMTSFYYERNWVGNYLIIEFYAESPEAESLIEELKKELRKGTWKEEDMNRLKKVWISSEVLMVDNISATIDNLLEDLIDYQKLIPNKVEIYQSLNNEELKEVYHSLPLDNDCVVYVDPSTKEME